jgi:uncharacterized protein DUF5054
VDRAEAVTAGDDLDVALTSRLVLLAEHNWGLSTGQYLKNHEAYSPLELRNARVTAPAFQKMDDEWTAKCRNIDIAAETLPADMRMEAHARLAGLAPVAPKMTTGKVAGLGLVLEGEHFDLAFDAGTAAIVKLRNRKTGREWASSQHPLASFRYETFTSADFGRFNAEYNTAKFAANDFGKPGLDRFPVESKMWQPNLQSCSWEENTHGQRVVVEMQMPVPERSLQQLVSWPGRLTLEVWLPKEEPAVYLTLQCFEKRANRLPEAMWLSFSPDAPQTSSRHWRFCLDTCTREPNSPG